jgi:hypothetical protein
MTHTQRVKRDRQHQYWGSPPPKAVLLRMFDDNDQTNKILLRCVPMCSFGVTKWNVMGRFYTWDSESFLPGAKQHR